MSDAHNIYRCTPRQVKKFVTEALFAGLVPYVQSSPGCGKSSIMRAVAKELNLKLIDHRLSTSSPEDLSGLPTFREREYTDPDTGLVQVIKEAQFVPFADLFPIKGTPLPPGKQGWMLFLDEFNSAPKGVMSAAYKLILDKMTGQYPLHENVVICAAGNLATDRAITNPLSTALQSRVVHLEMQVNFEEWLQDVALAENYDSRIVAYLSQYNSKLMDFRPDHQEKTFCCPRTWEFVNALIKGKELTDESAVLLAGTITSGVAVEFVQFTKVFNNLITIKDIIADPENCRLANDVSTKWATIAHMMEKVDDKNFDALSRYANRFTIDFRILFYRSVLVRHSQLRGHSAFVRAMAELSRYLHS